MTSKQLKRLAELRDELDAMASEEEDKRDNTPENLQTGDAWEKKETTAEKLREAVESIEEVINL